MKKKNNFVKAIGMIWDDKKEIVVSLGGAIVTLLGDPSQKVARVQFGVIIIILGMLTYALIDTWKLIKEKHIPIIVDVGDDLEYVESMRNTVYDLMRKYKFNSRIYLHQLGIKEAYLTVHEDHYLSSDMDEWRYLVETYADHLYHLNTDLEGIRNFHIFMKCPVSLAVGLGAVTGTKNAVALYHYIDGRYEKVINIVNDEKASPMGTHSIKDRVDQPFKYIKVIEPEKEASHLFISLGLASHPPFADVYRLTSSKDVAILNIANIYNNTLSTSEDWLMAAREALTAIMKWASKKSVNKVDLFISAPLPLAFAIGMGLGRQSAITVHQWFAQESAYHPVLELNQLYPQSKRGL